MTLSRILLLCMALAAAGSTWAANLGITPVAVHMSGATNRATVNVVNSGEESVTMQVEAIAWNRVNGVDQDGETSDVMVNPGVFTIAPGESQIIRVGLRKPSDQPVESTYRLVLREVPTANTAVTPGTNVRVLVAMRIPVYVAPAQVQRDEKWKVSTDAKGNLAVRLQNDGNVHYKIGGIKVHPGSDNTATPIASTTEGGVVFPGETRNFLMRPSQLVNVKNVTLEVFTDTGPQYIPVDLTRGG